ncbi:aminofutalosine synthase MqnE [Geoalkalibacter halelectricus]|uniref:Aminodeoxyfutalosine synthase n=1 Tax=Geoalkalibacter halelectricus TaxID=2847045 RepID=A0ABY5ZJ55_9BACT|nr:aminofutalosine synthase MqnE [Geoalkalibacter halelectricus]MDO3378129.1 aminofutalosine synthase MqnE [Geoalkalibacter halelectricus]UWZ77975.1 aminofutalosine synthase MqnE [Geoalkalibacter halelectricus]
MIRLFETIRAKLESGARISDAEALALFECNDLLTVGELAALANRRRNGDKVYFNINRHINYTNLCVNRCTFCAFCKGEEDEGCYTLALNDILAKAGEAAAAGATELHMVGGLHPELPFDFYLEMLAALRADCPRLHLKAFTAVEIDYFARLTEQSVEQVIAELQQAGLGSMPGGGAEILGARVREKICPEKISGERWLEVTEKVHRAGLKTNATMLFGHVEEYADRVDHLARLRRLQDRTGGFQAFIPLAFQPDNTRVPGARGVGGVDALKTLAISRIYLDNFRHIKAYWVMLGLKIAQVALAFGVNDLDGTVVEEKIGHDAGADSPQALSKEQLCTLIRKAGRVPVERDTLYRELRAY